MGSKLKKSAALGSGLLALGLAFSGIVAPQTAFALPTADGDAIISPDYKDDTRLMNYAVNLAASATDEQLTQLQTAATELGAKLLEAYPEFNTFFAQSEKGSFASALAAKAKDLGIPLHSIGNTRTAAVTGAEALISVPGASSSAGGGGATSRNSTRVVHVTPDPDTTPVQRTGAWGVVATGALGAQDAVDKRTPVRVAVIDSGIDGDHEDLQGQIDESTSVGCAVNGVPDTSRAAWQDHDGHGTHVAGTIAAAHNGIGVDGMNPNATLVAIRTGNDDGLFYPEYVACAFDWAAEHNIDISNNSYYVDPWAYWVPTEADQAAGYEAVRRAVEYATNAGVLNVVAAGNADTDNDHPTTDSESPNDVEGAAIANRDVTNGKDIPTMLPDVVSVSATRIPRGQTTADGNDSKQIRVTFSNYGATSVHIAAPGTFIYSTVPGNKYEAYSGTSMASPHVAGALSLLKSTHPTLSNAELKQLLFKKAAAAKDRLLPDPEGKQYEGNGFLYVLARAGVDSFEYTVDGTNWMPVPANGELNLTPFTAKTVQFRAKVHGSIKGAEIKVGDTVVASGTTTPLLDGSELSFASKDSADLSKAVAGGSAPVSLVLHALGGDITTTATATTTQLTATDDKGAVTAQARKGEKVTFTASKLPVADGTKVFFYLHSTPLLLGSATASGGTASLTVDKLDAEVGDHTVVATSEETDASEGAEVLASGAFKVLDAAPAAVETPAAPKADDSAAAAEAKGAKTLATTGANMALPFGAASLLLLAGAAAAIAGTRRLQRRN